MKALLQRYATPLITGLFLVSLISGIAIFFHLGNAYFHSMHEWLSMVLIAPFFLHIWRNWRAFTNYFSRSPMIIALVVSVIVALPFVFSPSSGRAGGPPQFALANAMLASTIEKVAPVLGEMPDALAARLRQDGFTAADTDLALGEIATRSGKSTAELAATLVNSSP